mmetsp:Transcript_2028/g.3026  ORF Transcript_2028/g.3026 Transcript_2028/m.3026 type:complete len:208 (-) Transcript_2028:8-631(-)
MPTGTSTTASGKTIRPTGSESTLIQTEPSTRGTGSMTSNTARAVKSGLMALNTRAIISSERKMDLASSSGPTNLPTKAISSIITSTAMASTSGPTAVSSRETGSAIRCTDEVSSPGPTAAATKVSTTMTRSTAMESSLGQTAGSTTAPGLMVSKKELEYTTTLKEIFATGCGRMESASTGLQSASSRSTRKTDSNNICDYQNKINRT